MYAIPVQSMLPTFSQYNSAVLTKALLLTHGLDYDFEGIRHHYRDTLASYRANLPVISDRHAIDVNSLNRTAIFDELVLSSGDYETVIKTYYSKTSPFLLTVSDGALCITSKDSSGALSVDVSPIRKFSFESKREDGTLLRNYLNVVGLSRITLVLFSGCEFFPNGVPCAFCGAVPNKHGTKQASSSGNLFHDTWPDDVREGFEAWLETDSEKQKKIITIVAAELNGHTWPKYGPHFTAIAGATVQFDLPWLILDNLLATTPALRPLVVPHNEVSLMPPSDLDLLWRAKANGITSVAFNLEVWTQEDFARVCPGKEAFYGYDKMLEALDSAVVTFQAGNVRTNLVLGAQDIDKTKEGVVMLAKRGIAADHSIFFSRPKSVWKHKDSISAEEALSFSEFTCKVFRDFGYKPFSSPLGSRSSLHSDIDLFY